jgi:hypothetical protein
MGLDSTIIDLSVTLFDWAKFRRTKGAIKLHLLLDHDGYLPSFALITEGKVSEKVSHQFHLAPGTIVVDDRAYNDYALDGEVRRYHEKELSDGYRFLLFDGVVLKQKGGAKVQKRIILCAFGETWGGRKK